MQFSNFSRLEEGLTILLYNEIPIENVGEIKYFTDNSNGTIVKKEFRWSFNNEHWASWEVLTQSAISRINTFNNYYFFLQIRYTLTAIGLGNVTTFTLNYKEGTATPITPRVLTSDIQRTDASAVLIHDILQKYEVTKITDASTLLGNPPKYYLNRSNHFGTQPISSITNLQTILNNISTNKFVKESSLGLGTSFDWVNGILETISGGGGVSQTYVDGSLNNIRATYIPDVSLNPFYFNWNNGFLDVSVVGSGSDINAWNGLLKIDNSIGLGGILTTDISINLDSNILTFIGDVDVQGDFTATTKSFLINHPSKPGKKLQYGNLEGPEHAIYIRGKYNNNIIELPDYWKQLIDENTITVNLTSLNYNIPYVKYIKNNIVYIGKIGFGKFLGYYTIFAERKDVSKLIVEK